MHIHHPFQYQTPQRPRTDSRNILWSIRYGTIRILKLTTLEIAVGRESPATSYSADPGRNGLAALFPPTCFVCLSYALLFDLHPRRRFHCMPAKHVHGIHKAIFRIRLPQAYLSFGRGGSF